MKKIKISKRQNVKNLRVLLGVLFILTVCAAPVTTQSTPVTTSRPTSQPVQYQPGIMIDWARREVRVDATVIMRKGAIELFACSPQQREHESIVRIEARPTYLFQALGLIGLTPGHPIRLNPDNDKVEPATGDPVEIEVRYESGGQVRQDPIERWLKLANTSKPLDPQPWIFAGSTTAEGGGITADGEGTVIALVDFGSALIGLPERHSDSNEALWLEPSSENIPQEGTKCTLIFRAGPMRIEMDVAGRLRLDGKSMSVAALGRSVMTRQKENPELKVEVRLHAETTRDREMGLRQLLRDMGVSTNNLSVTRPASE
jgi:hypothetical protein